MKKLKLKNLVSIFVVTSLLSSCGDLEENNSSVIPVEDLSAESLLEGAYGALREDEVFEANGYPMLWGDSGVDIISSPRFFNQTTIDTNLILPSDNAALQMWQAHFGSLATINRAIAITTRNQNGANKLDEDIFNDIIAQERFLRALIYFNLVRAYERPPLVTEDDVIFDVNELDIDNPPGNALPTDVYKLIEQDLLFASTNLKGGSSDRATPLAAKGMLGKVYLTIAGLLKHNVIQPTGDDPVFSFSTQNGITSAGKIYEEALKLFNEVENSGRYSLMPNYEEVFSDENNAEIIFRVNFTSNGSDGGSQYGDLLGALGNPPNGSFPGRLAQTELGMAFFDGPELLMIDDTGAEVPFNSTYKLQDYKITGGVYDRYTDADVGVTEKLDGNLVNTDDVGNLIEIEREQLRNLSNAWPSFQYPLITSDQRFLVNFNTYNIGRVNQTQDINDTNLNLRNGALSISKWRKELPSNSIDVNDRNTDYPVLRFADILLMKAEALAHMGQDDDAIEYVNKVRRRAYNLDINAKNGKTDGDIEKMNLREDGVHTTIDRYREIIGSSLNDQDKVNNGDVVSNARAVFGNRFPQGKGNWDRYLRTTVQPTANLIVDLEASDFPDTNGGVLGAILSERRKEFCFEGHRRDDLIRNGVLETVVKNVGANKTPSPYTTLFTRYSRVSFGNIPLGNNTEGDPSTDYDAKVYRFPIPQTEIANNPNLTQNSGY